MFHLILVESWESCFGSIQKKYCWCILLFFLVAQLKNFGANRGARSKLFLRHRLGSAVDPWERSWLGLERPNARGGGHEISLPEIKVSEMITGLCLVMRVTLPPEKWMVGRWTFLLWTLFQRQAVSFREGTPLFWGGNQTIQIPRKLITLSEDDWGVQSTPQQWFYYHSKKVIGSPCMLIWVICP